MKKNSKKILIFKEFKETDKIIDTNISLELKQTLIHFSNNINCVVSDFKGMTKKEFYTNISKSTSAFTSFSNFMIKAGFLIKDYDQFPYTNRTDLNSIQLKSNVLRNCLRVFFDTYTLKIQMIKKISELELRNYKEIKEADIKEFRKILKKAGVKW